jgi:hypothetical protein
MLLTGAARGLGRNTALCLADASVVCGPQRQGLANHGKRNPAGATA